MTEGIARLIGRLSVGRKLALIYFLDLTAVIFVSSILINEKFIAINFANKEIVGVEYISVVREVLVEVAGDGALPVDGDRRAALAAELVRAENRFGAAMGTSSLSTVLEIALQGAGKPGTATLRLGEPDPAFNAGRELLTRIGNQSNLILDPDLDSYYTMSLIVLRFPELLEILHSTRLLLQQSNSGSEEDAQKLKTQFLILEGRLDSILRGIGSDYDEAFAASSPVLRTGLAASQERLQTAVRKFLKSSQATVGISAEPATGNSLSEDYAGALAALREAWFAAEAELDRLLRERITKAFQRMWMHLGTAVLLLSIILTLVFFVARQIASPIRTLAGVAERVRRTGDYKLRVMWESRDEIGRMVSGFNEMLGQLDQQRLAQQHLVAQASAAEAQRLLFQAIPIPLIVTAVPHHEVLHVNDAAAAWLSGRERDPWVAGMAPDARIRFFQQLSDLGAVDEFEAEWHGRNGPVWALLSARRMDYQGQSAVLTMFTPINHTKQMEQRLALWAKVFEASSESIVIMDAGGSIASVNKAFCRSSGYELEELIGCSPSFLLAERNEPDLLGTIRHTCVHRGMWQGEVWVRRKSQEAYPAWLVMNAVRDAHRNVTHFIAISLDISERKANEQQIHYLAHHDVLTGLPNRFLCDQRMQLSIQQAKRNRTRLGVLFVDLDRFKNVNDSLGHHVGDGLLCSIAQRLGKAVREGDTVSRLGGDEFVIILNEVGDAEEIGKVVEQRLLPLLQQSHHVAGHELYISCSIGVAVFPDDGSDIDGLKRNADSAMYQAKRLGRNNVQFFTHELNERVMQHLHLESEMRHAVERNELVLYYQPRLDAHSGHLAGVECLVRWQHPTRGLLLPGHFIQLAEESGLIIELGAEIIRLACAQHARWHDQGMGEISFSVNLSAAQLRDEQLSQLLREQLRRYAIAPAHLELELTESILMEDANGTIKVLEAFKTLGITLSIDDFGTGYSSLNYLSRFPIDKLKIDRSFIQGLQSSPHDLSITRAIISLGHTLGLQVVAEGVERESDVQMLKEAGCDELQGYHFSKPLDEQAFRGWLSRNHAPIALPA